MSVNKVVLNTTRVAEAYWPVVSHSATPNVFPPVASILSLDEAVLICYKKSERTHKHDN